MFAQPHDKIVSIKAFFQDFIEDQQGLRNAPVEEGIRHLEIVVIIKDVQVVDGFPIGQFPARRIGDNEVKNGKGVPQGAVCLGGNQPEGLLLIIDLFFGGNVLEVLGDVLDLDPVKVEDLAARQDGGDDFMFFCRCQDKDGVLRRDRKSTRLNSSHVKISYAVFCL